MFYMSEVYKLNFTYSSSSSGPQLACWSINQSSQPDKRSLVVNLFENSLKRVMDEQANINLRRQGL